MEYDPSYSGDHLNYLYQKEERDLQEKLFQMYEELSDEGEEEEGYTEEETKE